MRDIEKEIIDFIDQEYNTKKYFLCGPKRIITLDTERSPHNFPKA